MSKPPHRSERSFFKPFQAHRARRLQNKRAVGIAAQNDASELMRLLNPDVQGNMERTSYFFKPRSY